MQLEREIAQALKEANEYLNSKLKDEALLLKCNEHFSASYWRLLDTLKLLPDIPHRGCKVLDIGFGYGHIMYAITKLYGWEVYGIDVNIHPQLREIFPNVFDFDIQGEWASNGEKEFDIILFCEVLEHLNPWSISHVLRKIRDLLGDGGYLILTTPNAAALSKRLKFMLGKEVAYPLPRIVETNDASYQRHAREYTTREVTETLHNLGFSIDRVFQSKAWIRYEYQRSRMLRKPFILVYYLVVSFYPRFASLIMTRSRLPERV